MVLIPLPSDGSSSTLLVKSDDAYKAPWNRIRQQRRLPATKMKYDGIEIPNKCQGLKGGKFDKCMKASLATLNSSSKDDIGTTSSLASGIVSSWNEHEHQPTVHDRPTKKQRSTAAPSVSFISSSPSTVSAYGAEVQSPSHAPTHVDLVSSLSMDDTASPTSLLVLETADEYPSDVDANGKTHMPYGAHAPSYITYHMMRAMHHPLPVAHMM